MVDDVQNLDEVLKIEAPPAWYSASNPVALALQGTSLACPVLWEHSHMLRPRLA